MDGRRIDKVLVEPRRDTERTAADAENDREDNRT
jgi:hypothetical protein